MVKYFRSVSTQLDSEDYYRLIDICNKYNLKPYHIIKKSLLDFIDSYEWVDKEKPKKEMNNVITELNSEEYDKLVKICQKQDLKLHQGIKKSILDFIDSYEWVNE